MNLKTKVIFGAAVLALALGAASPVFAQDEGIDYKVEIDPNLGLDNLPEAQPSFDGQKPGWAQFTNHYAAKSNDINQPNHTTEEIVAWGGGAVSDALSFTPTDFTAQVKEKQKKFLRQGWREYAKFMRGIGLLEHAEKGKYLITAITEREPVIVASGVQDEAWTWTFRVPVIISVATEPDVETGDQKILWSRRFSLTIVLTRTNEGMEDSIATTENADKGLAIRGWALTTK